MKTKIVQKDADILRQVAKPVAYKDLGSKKIATIIDKMKKALHGEEDGVAIAAPQIGESLRIFVVSGNVLDLIQGGEEGKKSDDLVCINPEITKVSKKQSEMEEGCLSIRWLYGKVKRSEKITIKTHDQEAKTWEIGASGILAQIFQHEIDHLEGVLFTDKAKDVKDLPPEDNKK